jgi:hypothetical protein
MVVYRISCDEGHSFEGWYASAEAFEREAGAGHLECPVCGTSSVRKHPAAPYVHTASAPAPATDADRQGLERLKTYILANTENVGREFPEVARRIHYGEEKSRGIRGQVTRAEAEALKEEGVPAWSVPPGMKLADEVH